MNERERIIGALPAQLQATARTGLSHIYQGTHWDGSGGDPDVATALAALGWTVEWRTWTVGPDATLDGRPHPRAGQDVHWFKATPPAYDRQADPVAHATARAVEATGNSDGAGRGAGPWAPGAAGSVRHALQDRYQPTEADDA